MPQFVTLKAEYTQKDLFFTALEVQFEEFKKTQDPRCFESPRIVTQGDGSLILNSAEKDTALVSHFYDAMKRAKKNNDWEAVRQQSPFQLNAKRKREAKLNTFNKYQLANFLSAIILQFQKDMTDFLSQDDIRKKMQKYSISENQLMLAASNVLQPIFAPLGEMAVDDEQTRIIYGFCTAAITKFCLRDGMVPQPKDTLDGACDAMLRQVSLTLTQPIGAEKFYGGMLGKDTPMDKMDGALLGTELHYEQNNISIQRSFYVIPAASFLIEENSNDEKILAHILSSNLDFLNQADSQQLDPALLKIIAQRLCIAFLDDSRCPEWIRDRKEILLNKFDLCELFFNMLNRLSNASHGIEYELSSLIKETLLVLTKEAELIFSDAKTNVYAIMESMIKRLSGLIGLYRNEKTLNAQLCLAIAARVQIFIYSIPDSMLNSPEFFDDLKVAIEEPLSLGKIIEPKKNFLDEVFKKAFNSSLSGDEFIIFFKDLVHFSLNTGMAIDFKKLFTGVVIAENSIDSCRTYIQSLPIAPEQKRAFNFGLSKVSVVSSEKIWRLPFMHYKMATSSPTTVARPVSPDNRYSLHR